MRVSVTDAGTPGDQKVVLARLDSPVTKRDEPTPASRAKEPESPQVAPEPLPVVPPRDLASNAAQGTSVSSADNIDPGIRPIRSLTVDIGVPVPQENQSLRVPMPVDEASGYFQKFPAAPPENSAYIPWMLDDSYNPPLNFCYRPLYFEDVNLERYGYSWGIWQPAVSTMKFCANTVLLPYRMITQPPCKCTYHAHLSRPGGPAPRERQVLKGPLARFKD